MTKSKSDKYEELFKCGTPFEQIQAKMNVKKSTVYTHFMKFLYKYETSIYDDFILDELPAKEDCDKITKLDKQNYPAWKIKYQVSEEVTVNQVQLVCYLYHNGELEDFLIQKNPDCDISSYQPYIVKSVYEGLFCFLSSKDQFRLKQQIGKFLSHYSVNWEQDGEFISPDDANALDLKDLAEAYMKHDGHNRLRNHIYGFRFLFEPDPDDLIRDIAIQIDYKVPKNYFVKHIDFHHGNRDHTESSKDYKDIKNTPGIRYQFVENYFRDGIIGNCKHSNTILFDTDIKPSIIEGLKDQGYVFKDPDNLTDEDCLTAVHFILFEDRCPGLMDLIEYE